MIANALTGCSVNFDHIFDPINTFQMQLPVFHSLLGSLRGIWCKIIYSFTHLGYFLGPEWVGGSGIGFNNEFRKYFPIRQVVPVGDPKFRINQCWRWFSSCYHNDRPLQLFCIYESEFTRIRSYKHLSPQIDRERFNGVLYKL